MSGDKGKKQIAFGGLMLVNFIVMFLIAGVGVYSYTIAAQFDNLASVSMIFTLECVARGVSIPMGGTIGNKIGHKKLFLRALLLYIVSYGVAAFATNFWVFTIARMVSGFAWGLFIMNVFVLITAIFGQEEAPKYSGYNQALTTVAMIVGSPIAGVVCAINWRILFFVTVPLLIIGWVICMYSIPDIPPVETENIPLDGLGIAATAVTLVPFSLAMNWGNTMGWTSPLVMGLLAAAIIGLIVLAFAERRAANPIIPYKLLSNKFYFYILMLMLVYSILNGAGNYLATYAQSILGLNSQIAGLINVPGLIIAVFLTTYFGNQAAKTGKYKGMVIIWAVFSTIGAAAWFFLGSAPTNTVGIILLFAGVIPVAAVNSVNQIAPYTYPMAVLKPEELASGLAFIGLAGALGSTISGGICGAIMNSSGGLPAVYKMPIICAIVMLYFAFRFKDTKGNQAA